MAIAGDSSINYLGGPGAFFNWAAHSASPTDLEGWAKSNNYTPQQVAGWYNEGGQLSPGKTGYVNPATANYSGFQMKGNTGGFIDAQGLYHPPEATSSWTPTPAASGNNSTGWNPAADLQQKGTGPVPIGTQGKPTNIFGTSNFPGSGTLATGGTSGTSAGSSSGLPDLFQPGLFSSSNSWGNSLGMNTSNQNSFSGLPEGTRNQLLTAILPQLTQSIGGLNAVPGQTADAASRMYGNLSRQALEQSLPDILNQLAGRGVLNSSVGSDAISNAAMQIIPNFANAGYQSQIDAGNQRMQIPNILGTLLGLGNYSQGSSTGMGLNTSQNASQSSNPLEPYQLLSNFLMGY